MRQLITRVDDGLHRQLKERAAEQERSLNDLVTAILVAALEDGAVSWRHRLHRSGLRVLPPAPAGAQPRAVLIERLRGAGRPVSEALVAERDAR